MVYNDDIVNTRIGDIGNSINSLRAYLDDKQLPYVEIVVVEAVNLIAADVNGKSDPFVVLKLGDRRLKTSTKMATLNPRWEERLLMSIEVNEDNIPIHTLLVDVFDWDRFTQNDELGSVIIDLSVS